MFLELDDGTGELVILELDDEVVVVVVVIVDVKDVVGATGAMILVGDVVGWTILG